MLVPKMATPAGNLMSIKQSLYLNIIYCPVSGISKGYSGRHSGYSDSVNFFSMSPCSMQEAQGSLLYIKLDCPGSEEAIEVLLDDEDDVPDAVELNESKCFG